MIKPIKSNIAFTNNNSQAPIEKKKFDVAQTYQKVKKGATDIAKDVITTVNMGGGAIDGIVNFILQKFTRKIKWSKGWINKI